MTGLPILTSDAEGTVGASSGIIVFTGYNQRAVIAFLRTLELHHLPCYLVATGSEDTIFLTSYAARVGYTRTSKALTVELIEDIVAAARAHLGVERLLIAPSTEYLNRYLLTHRAEVEAAGVELPLVNATLYQRISDKQAFTQLCRETGVTVPEEYQPEEVARFPVVAKPRVYQSSSGTIANPVILQSREEFEEFCGTHAIEDFLFQEHIDGRCLYLLYYFGRNGAVARYSQENLVQQPGGKSMVAARSTDLHEQAISQQYEVLFHSVGFHGLVMIEVKQQGNRYVMIEANPRFWGPSQLFVDSGVNLFEELLADYQMLERAPSRVPHAAQYFWSGGFTGIDADEMTYYIPREEWNTLQEEFAENDLFNRDDTQPLHQHESGAR